MSANALRRTLMSSTWSSLGGAGGNVEARAAKLAAC